MIVPSSFTDKKDPELDRLKEASFYRTLDCLFNEEKTSFAQEAVKCRKIMLVDDSADTRKEISKTLTENGYEVVEFSSGVDALDNLETVKPDLLLIEIVMQEMDGLVVCESMRENDKYKEIPIIFLTNLSNKGFVIRGLQAGASDYIVKPFEPSEALARIHNHLRIRDLTQEKERNNAKLQESNDALQSAILAKDKLLGVTTHDLKNPLFSIKGILDFMIGGDFGELNEEQEEMLSEVVHATDSMIELVSDLLNLATIEANELKLEKKEHNMAELTKHLINLCQFQAEQKDIKLYYEKLTNVSEAAYDERQVRRVIQNLISNAIKFSPSEKTIYVRLEQDADFIRFAVEDEGPGIPKEEQSKLFTEYGTTSVKSTAGEASTGLGLSICKKIIEAHGGKIWMENRDEGGARFAFKLPRYDY